MTPEQALGWMVGVLRDLTEPMAPSVKEAVREKIQACIDALAPQPQPEDAPIPQEGEDG